MTVAVSPDSELNWMKPVRSEHPVLLIYFDVRQRVKRRTRDREQIEGAVTSIGTFLGGLLELGMRDLIRLLKPAYSHN
jgi:hypothetical protein